MLHSTNDIKRAHKGYWFSYDTMRFFSSRVSADAYRTDDGRYSFFVTSEKNEYSGQPRLYSVRVYDWTKDTVSTVGEFQSYATSTPAKRAAERFALNLPNFLTEEVNISPKAM